MFQILGKDEIYKHTIQINAEDYTPVTAELTPTGEILPVADTPFDLRVPKTMKEIIGSKTLKKLFNTIPEKNY